MKTPQRASGKQKSSAPTDPGAVARIEVRRIGDKVRLEVSGASPDAAVLIQQFVSALNGQTFDPHLRSPAFKRAIRLTDVGLDDGEEVDSIALEADVAHVPLDVDDPHQRRAAAFCRRHRFTTSTEAMDDLAAEFERVTREARADTLRRLADVCRDQASLAIDGALVGRDQSEGDGG
jgi:hypothetical protein